MGHEVRVMYMICPLLYLLFLLLVLLLFHYVSTTTGGAGRDSMGPAPAAQRNTGRDRGAGEWKEEVEGWAAGLRKGVGRGKEWGEQGTETAGRLDDREGHLYKRAATVDKEDGRAGQGEGWATLLLSCLLLGFEICIKYIRT